MNDKIPGVGIHHVALSAHDFEASLRFYAEGLGCTVAARWGADNGRVAMLDIGNGICLELFANGTADHPAHERFVHLAFATTDPDTAYRNAIAAGAVSHRSPFDVVIPADPPMTVRLAFVRGPDGELLEFFKQ